jgi:hypothetical protein
VLLYYTISRLSFIVRLTYTMTVRRVWGSRPHYAWPAPCHSVVVSGDLGGDPRVVGNGTADGGISRSVAPAPIGLRLDLPDPVLMLLNIPLTYNTSASP